ncbi:hypothetical protein [Streptomyces californicus]|uniref:hypothetical protein n=1 Tax=Streptomyces californicus TaxID=67351 RepID=UPI003715909F
MTVIDKKSITSSELVTILARQTISERQKSARKNEIGPLRKIFDLGWREWVKRRRFPSLPVRP